MVIMARHLEKLEQLAGEIRAEGVKCLVLQCDVTVPD